MTSKPISISFGKSKTTTPAASGFALRKPTTAPPKPSRSTLHNNSDDEDEAPPQHEPITAFAANGAILTDPSPDKEQLVIKSAGNGDWRRRGRGKNLLPVEVQAQQDLEKNGDVVIIEKDEVAKTSGLQFAGVSTAQTTEANGKAASIVNEQPSETSKPLTEDEQALQALLGNDSSRNSTAVIASTGNLRSQPIDETDDFRTDVASRPDSCTLDEYAAMPVEEFGMAMLRGMGQKRRANGEIISYGKDEDTTKKAREPRQGYLGIGAKAAPGAEIELGAWGKKDMRKNDKGEGFYTPVVIKDKRTGEMITEEELERRKKEASSGREGGEDWRERRDCNLERSGRDKERRRERDGRNGEPKQKLPTDKDDSDYKDQMSGFSRHSSSRRDRDAYGSERSRNHRDRSRSRDRRKYDDEDDRDRERRKDKYRDRDDERYDSSSSRRSRRQERDRYDRDRGEDKRRRDR